ncbi:hypothetical protein [Arthrobacter sp. MMS18-M83]|uniref:hypothetical protein n=1 Tax=Arthrobacter sp. MMS18-M83 TaxID=2996261 RepID=UPI00227B72BF|nr:hypothetical protein [Arthrobacter sp. MMS18-M83]WAH99237.1 hypothetical protein OW521_10690 [Arthrobacter sp. MMS18-M83]
MNSQIDGLESPEERELRETLGTALATAQEHLEQNGGFMPFAVTLADDGEFRLVFVTPGEPDDEGNVDTGSMLADILELLSQGRDGYRAVAMASDVILPEHGSDGIHAAAEHRSGGLMAAVVPYVRTAEGFTFGAAEADGHERAVWVD